jgi:hypothetical protein
VRLNWFVRWHSCAARASEPGATGSIVTT